MWIFSKYGFYSIKQDGEQYHIRSLRREDLERLVRQLDVDVATANHYLYEIFEDTRADYRFRIIAGPDVLQRIMTLLGDSIDYPNFKAEIANVQPDRTTVYTRIWAVALELQRSEK